MPFGYLHDENSGEVSGQGYSGSNGRSVKAAAASDILLPVAVPVRKSIDEHLAELTALH